MTLKRDPKDIHRIMEMMAELELKISEFYRECGDVWKQEKDFWASLEKDEVSHAQSVRKMADILLARPETVRGEPSIQSRFRSRRSRRNSEQPSETEERATAGPASSLHCLGHGTVPPGNQAGRNSEEQRYGVSEPPPDNRIPDPCPQKKAGRKNRSGKKKPDGLILPLPGSIIPSV
jgi:hypothetical protein